MRTGPSRAALPAALFLVLGCGGDDPTGPRPVATVEIAPATRTLQLQEEAQLQVTLRDDDGNVLADRAVTWSTSNDAIIGVTATGLVRGVAVGTATITATSEGRSGTATVTVPAVATVEIGQTSPRVEEGHQVQLTAIVRDGTGLVLTNRVVDWESSNQAVATISATGMAAGVSAGDATITATSEGRGTQATLRVTPAQPVARWGHTLVYDEARGQLLLFGGSSGLVGTPEGVTFFDDLWEWIPATRAWRRVATGTSPTPPAREPGLSVYDSDRQVVVLHGGRAPALTGAIVLTDTWEWNGAAWTVRAVAGPTPPARTHAGGGYDPVRKRTVLHGGETLDNVRLRDTWEWDGTSWTERSTATPSTLGLPSRMVFDATRQTLVMLVGSPTDAPTELWEWNGSTWSIVGAGPSLAMPAPLSTSPNARLLLYDEGGTAAPTTWQWNGAAWAQHLGAAPTRRFGVDMLFHPGAQQVILFGGFTGALFRRDTWGWDGAAWHLHALP